MQLYARDKCSDINVNLMLMEEMKEMMMLKEMMMMREMMEMMMIMKEMMMLICFFK